MNRDARSDNAFERDMPGTNARTEAEAAIEELRQRGGLFVEAVRATRMPMALTDPNLPGNPIVFANQAFLGLSGYRMEEILGQQPHFMNGSGTDPKDAARFAEAIRGDQDDIIETVQYRKDGSRFVATVLISAFKDDQGRVLNHFMSWLDVTRRVDAEQDAADLREAQAALRESEEQLRLIVDSALDYAIFTMDLDKRITSWLPGAQHVFGWTPEEIVGQPVDITFTPEDRAKNEPQKETEEAKRTGTAPNVRWHVRKDGSRVFIDGHVVALRNEQGEVDGFLKIGQDTTERHRAREHERMLVAELQHRVRNTLAVIRSIVRRTANTADSVEQFEQNLDGRLSSFARTQAYVTRDFEGSMDLEMIVRDELLAHAAGDSEQVSIEGPPVRLTPKQAETISLAMHELASNAMKHGALAGVGNRVDVKWSLEGDGEERRLHLSWLETLNDRALETPQRSGFGTELLEKVMSYELDAEPEIEFRPNGLSYRVTIPLSIGAPSR